MTSELKRLALLSQGLTLTPSFGKGLAGTRKAIEHLGYVQIDSLSVVERAHHHILWSRVPGYNPSYLNKLLSKQHIFEYWFHAASYLPMRDYRYALPQMELIRSDKHRYYKNADKRLMREILARVRAEGVLSLRHIDNKKIQTKTGSHWWNSGAGRRALDKLFMQGDLMVCERAGIEKVFDLAERCLPEGIDLSTPTVKEYANYLFDTSLRAHGVFTRKQLLHLKTGKPLRDAMCEVLDERIDAGELEIWQDADAPPIYVDIQALEKAPVFDEGVKVLSPFDNVLIHRDRLSSLFNFDYRMECYVAATKRVYGYFCLPILYGDRFVARIDCKAHRAEQRLEVLNFHLEKVALDKSQFFPALRDELQKFADFNQCSKLDDHAIF